MPLSPSQIGRRLQRLEQVGVVDGYRVVLRPEKLGLGVTAFTSLKLKHHGDSIIEQFQQQIDVLPEVLECHAVVGDADYLLRIVAPDLNASVDVRDEEADAGAGCGQRAFEHRADHVQAQRAVAAGASVAGGGR